MVTLLILTGEDGHGGGGVSLPQFGFSGAHVERHDSTLFVDPHGREIISGGFIFPIVTGLTVGVTIGEAHAIAADTDEGGGSVGERILLEEGNDFGIGF